MANNEAGDHRVDIAYQGTQTLCIVCTNALLARGSRILPYIHSFGIHHCKSYIET